MIEVIGCSTDTISARIALPNSLGPSCLSPQQDRLYCALYPDTLFVVIDCAADTVIPPSIRVGSWPFVGCYSPAADKVYFGTYAGQDVAIIDCATNSVQATIPFPSMPWGMCTDPVSGNIYVTSRMTRQVLVLDGSGDSVLAAVEVGEVPGETYWNPVRHRAYIANENSHSVSVLRDAPGAIEEREESELRRVKGGATIVRGVLFLPSSLLSPLSFLLSVDGRKVLDLHAGPNDVSRLAPGVYFVRMVNDEWRMNGSKVVLTK